MFYTFVQNRVRGGFQGERLLCVEADTWGEANERAVFFGLELDVVEHGWDHPRWRAANRVIPRPTAQPQWSGDVLNAQHFSDYGYTFSILYKNDNLFSTGSLNLENEIAEYGYGDDEDVPEASECSDDWYIYDSGYYDDYDDYDVDNSP